MPLQQLRRIRWAVRATLLFGVAASVAANVLHALPNPISQGIAAWPPLALLLAVELISRIPMHRRSLAAARLLSTAAIASIAAWVSYWHMVGVAARYGESQASAYLLPLSVDGLIVVASVSLVELAGRIRSVEQEDARERQDARDRRDARYAQAAAASALAAPMSGAPAPAPVSPAAAPTFVPAPPLVAVPDLPAPAVSIAAPAAGAPSPLHSIPRTDFTWLADTAALSTSAKRSTPQAFTAVKSTTNATSRPTATASVPSNSVGSAKAGATKPGKGAVVNRAVGRAEVQEAGAQKSEIQKQDGPKQRRSVAETAALVAEIQADEPTITLPDLAERLGISVSRLRAVRREAAQLEQAAA